MYLVTSVAFEKNIKFKLNMQKLYSFTCHHFQASFAYLLSYNWQVSASL